MDINHKVSTSYWVSNGNSKPSTTLLKRGYDTHTTDIGSYIKYGA